MDQTAIIAQVTNLINAMASPLTSLSDFLKSLSSNTMLQIIDFIFKDNPDVGLSFNDILHAMYSPLVAIGFAVHDIFSMLPSNNLNLLELDGLSIRPQVTNKDLAIIVSVSTFAFKTGGIIYKILKGNPGDEEDKRFDNDIEFSGSRLTPFLSPQFFGSIGNFINGAVPAVAATVAIELTNPDAVSLQNLQRLQIVGFIKTGIAILHMAVLGGLITAGFRSKVYDTDPIGQLLERVVFALNAADNIYDITLQTIQVANNATPGLDIFAKSFALALKYLGFVNDLLVITTNNGHELSPRMKTAFEIFEVSYMGMKIMSYFLTMLNELNHINV